VWVCQRQLGFLVVFIVVMLGYSTERWEKHISDDPRTTSLDLRQRRGTGSLGDLDRLAYDPNFVSCYSDKLNYSLTEKFCSSDKTCFLIRTATSVTFTLLETCEM